MSKPTFAVRAVQPEDAEAIGQISADAFLEDRQTQMKALGQNPYDMRAEALRSLPDLLRNPRAFSVKAVDETTGEIMGFCHWGFRGFASEDLPKLDGKPAPLPDKATPTNNNSQNKEESANEEQKTEPEPQNDPIKKLEALTSADMNSWMEEVMPEGTKCMYVVGLSTAPKYQGRGVGKELLRWGTRICDARSVFAWVHSSDPGWKMYQKCGFRTIRKLDVDLDEYAPMPPPNEGKDAKWGHYVFHAMKYFPPDL